MTQTLSNAALNGFVDGELTPREAAHVAELMAKDPSVARQVAHLHQLKAALSSMPDTVVPPEVRHLAARPDTPSTRPGRAAVGVGAMLVALLWSAPLSPPEPPNSVVTFQKQHDIWSQQSAQIAQVALPAGFAWLTPVMQASGLTLMHHAHDGAVQHFGFKGVNDCRLSLFVTQATGPQSPLRLSLSDQVQHSEWHTGTAQFELIARDMAPARFATVATSLHRDSQAYRTDHQLHLALQQAARLPCSA